MAKLLSAEERNYVYNQLMGQLLKLELYNSPLEGIVRLKVIAKLFKDHAFESEGKILLPDNNRIEYAFYKDHRERTTVHISRSASGLKKYNTRVTNTNTNTNTKTDDNDVPILVPAKTDDDDVPILVSV